MGGSEVDEPFDRVVVPTDPALVIVTVAVGEHRDGCVVGFAGQTSIEPRRYGVWISKANATYRHLAEAEHLAVHLLGVGHRGLAELFGGTSGDEVDKFTAVPWRHGPHGTALLEGVAGHLILRIDPIVDHGGDHVLAEGAVVAAEGVGPAEPLRASALAGLHPGHASGEG